MESQKKSLKCFALCLLTSLAKTMQGNVFPFNSAPLFYLVGQSRSIEQFPIKIGNLAAIFTDNMMVIVNSSLKAGLTFLCLNPGNETVLLQSC